MFEGPQVRKNITHEESVALQNLSNNDSLVIKKADKGTNIVVHEQERLLQRNI